MSKVNQSCLIPMTLLNPFKKVGKTIVLVSCALDLVRSWCDEAIWLDASLLKKQGKPADPPEAEVEAYTKEML